MNPRLLLLVVGSALAATILFEVGLRVADLPRPPTFVTEANAHLGLRADPDVFWRMDTSVTQWHINEQGLRGRAITGTPGPTTFRIACVGDSCTFGVGATYEQTYGLRLAARLQQSIPGGLVETVLGATPAFSSHQTLALYENDIRDLEPDLTVVYCGAWNDYQPRIEGQTDREIGARARWSRILAVVQRLGGSSADGPDVRVPIEDFEANLRGLVHAARQNGDAILVVPPVRADTVTEWPACLDYQAAVRRVAAAVDAPLVDGPALFAAFEQDVGAEWFSDEPDVSPMFGDEVHPTGFGHALIADALADVVEGLAPPKLARLRALPANDADASTVRVSPSSVPALAETEIEVRGLTPELRAAVTHAQLGDVWTPRRTSATDGVLRFVVPATMRPGTRRFVLFTPDGPVFGPSVDVRPPQLDARIETGEDGRRELVVTLHAEPHRTCGFFTAAARAENGARTQWGTFELAMTRPGRPANRPDFPFRLPHYTSAGMTDANGTWVRRVKLPDLGRTVFVQGLVVANDEEGQTATGAIASLTETVRIDV